MGHCGTEIAPPTSCVYLLIYHESLRSCARQSLSRNRKPYLPVRYGFRPCNRRLRQAEEKLLVEQFNYLHLTRSVSVHISDRTSRRLIEHWKVCLLSSREILLPNIFELSDEHLVTYQKLRNLKFYPLHLAFTWEMWEKLTNNGDSTNVKRKFIVSSVCVYTVSSGHAVVRMKIPFINNESNFK